MSTFISENTDEPMPIICRFCERSTGQQLGEFAGKRVTAVRLRGQWEGGDEDEDPRWVPVCMEHDSNWDKDLDPKYLLPAFDLETWWVAIARAGSWTDPKTAKKSESVRDMLIGPFPDEASAVLAMNESLLVQGELEDPGGEDCFVVSERGRPNERAFEVVLIHLDNPDYTGEEEP